MRILAVSPHSDDVEIGCGGYLYRAVQQGHTVAVVLVLAKPEMMEGALVHGRTRVKEFFRAMTAVGAHHARVIVQTEDIEYDLYQLPKQRAVTALDKEISEFNPDQVLLPVPSFHQDHQYTHEVGIAATRPTKIGSSVKEVLLYEYPAANWGPSAGLDSSRGGTYVDITGGPMEAKTRMLKLHESQMFHGSGGLISLESVDAWARMRGFECGATHAELMYLLRRVM